MSDEVDDFLTQYAASLTAFDAQGSASLWAMPGMIVDDRFSGVVSDRETMTQGLEQSYPVYRALGLASVGHECLKVESLTEAIKLVQVRWQFYDADGTLLTDSNACYVLRRGETGFEACVCIQTDDAEKLQALATERGINLSDLTE